MATCPHCNSNNYRLQEPGVVKNAFYCMDCKRSFDKFTPGTKKGAIGVVIGIIAALLGLGS